MQELLAAFYFFDQDKKKRGSNDSICALRLLINTDGVHRCDSRVHGLLFDRRDLDVLHFRRLLEIDDTVRHIVETTRLIDPIDSNADGEVHREQNRCRARRRIATGDQDSEDLVPQLYWIAVQGAVFDTAVDVALAEQACKQCAHDSTDAVATEDIQRVVDMKEALLAAEEQIDQQATQSAHE